MDSRLEMIGVSIFAVVLFTIPLSLALAFKKRDEERGMEIE